MKRGTRQHPKFKALCASLGIPEYAGVGLLESLWMTVEEFQDDGAIGRWSDRRIAGAIGWDGDAGQLVMFLVECEWLDRVDGADRLVVHDWLSHCSSYVWDRVKKRVQRARASDAGKAAPSTVATWLGAMVDKASAERSRNSSFDPSSGREVAGEAGPEPDQPTRKRPDVSGSVRQRPAASGSSDPYPRPKTQDPRPSPTTVVVVDKPTSVGVVAADSPTSDDSATSTTSSTTTTTQGGEVEPSSNPMALSLIDVPCTDRFFPVDQGLLDRLQDEFPELYVMGEVTALTRHLRTHPDKQRSFGKGLESVRKWLANAVRNPQLRAKRPDIAGTVGAPGAKESAMERKRQAVTAALR